MIIKECRLIQAPTFSDDRGNLSFVELGQLLNFVIKRVYWLYDIKLDRGGHAHKKLQQLIFCLHGSIDIIVDNGDCKDVVRLDNPNKGLYIEKPLWREITHFQNNPQLVVLASEVYQKEDYINSYEEFKKWKLNF